MADSPYAGTLSNYYAFPFIFALFWPLAAWRLEGRSDVLQDKRYLGGFVAMLAATFLGLAGQQNPQNIDLPESFSVPRVGPLKRAQTRPFVRLARIPRWGVLQSTAGSSRSTPIIT